MSDIFTGCPTCGAAPMQECRDESRATLSEVHCARTESSGAT